MRCDIIDIKEKDQFINSRYFQWQTPNSTAPSSERGINLHLFVRKYKEIDRVVQPYIYIGKGDVVKSEGEKPITVMMALEHEVPAHLYLEFTKKV